MGTQSKTAKQRALRAMDSQDTQKVMGIMFDRLYTLRNQLLHGGATWNSDVNRSQISRVLKSWGRWCPLLFT